MPYQIEYAPDAENHLRALSARQRTIVLDAVDDQLAHQPGVETRNRKPMRPNPLAPWELRIDDLRVYYDIEEKPVQRVACCGRGHQESQSYPDRRGGSRFMKVIESADATRSLADFAAEIDQGTVIVTRQGQPVAALVAIENTDLETAVLSTNARFLELVERSRTRARTEGSLSSAEMRRRLG